MDISVLIGLVSGIGLVLYGILGSGELSYFYDPASIAITLGGVVAATIISYPLKAFTKLPKYLKVLFGKNKYNPNEYIEKVVDYAQEARRKGLLALENKADQEEDEFLKNCVLLIVDAIEPEKARDILENDLSCLEQRHQEGWVMFEKMAVFSPAYGMIGTLIGLINMLKSMGDLTSGDAASGLGDGMATALITTFYGSMLANLLFVPVANKLRYKHGQEMLCKEMIVEGVLDIHAGVNPRHIEEKLKAYLTANEQANISNGDGEATGKKSKKSKKKKGK